MGEGGILFHESGRLELTLAIADTVTDAAFTICMKLLLRLERTNVFFTSCHCNMKIASPKPARGGGVHLRFGCVRGLGLRTSKLKLGRV